LVATGLKTEVASARSELNADGVGLRNEIKTEATGLHGEMVGRFEATNARVDATRAEVKADVAGLRNEINAKLDAVLRQQTPPPKRS
jgi:hypothetical protein